MFARLNLCPPFPTRANKEKSPATQSKKTVIIFPSQTFITNEAYISGRVSLLIFLILFKIL